MIKKLSFVIPCYGSEKTICSVVEELEQVIKQRKNFEWEIILVNDNSPDDVWREISKLAECNPNITGISLARNFGQHSALMAGYSFCKGDVVISLDDDGQSPVESIYQLVDKLKEGYDVVYGYYPTMKQKQYRKIGSMVNEKLTESLLGKPKGFKGSSFYAARGFIIKEMLKYKNAYPYVGGLVFRCTKNITNIPVKHRERMEGMSGYTFGKLFSLWSNGFTAFSEKPLRLASYVGVMCAMFGFLYGVFTIVHRIMNPEMQMGYSSLMAVLLFVGGIIMLLLGVLGEYIGRIYISINSAPQYVIRDVVGEHSNI
ncbi:MAG: glycosyltransferase [Lachnospiraceae bacterium]